VQQFAGAFADRANATLAVLSSVIRPLDDPASKDLGGPIKGNATLPLGSCALCRIPI